MIGLCIFDSVSMCVGLFLYICNGYGCDINGNVGLMNVDVCHPSLWSVSKLLNWRKI